MQIVRTMAIGTNGGIDFFLLQNGNAVDALFVTHNRAAFAEMKFFHVRGFAVASAASRREIAPVDWRGGVPVIQQFMRAAVTVPARSRFRNAFVNRLSVVALEIDIGFHPVTLTARDWLVRFGVRQIGNVGVTTRAEIFCVDGIREFLLVHK